MMLEIVVYDYLMRCTLNSLKGGAVITCGGHQLKSKMDITRDNFLEYYQEVIEQIKDCSFIAFDTEFSGLLDDGFREAYLDVPSERYEKLRNGTQQFVIMQFGICLFKKITATKYTAQPYNFFVFPASPTPKKIDLRFLCQASSMTFLADNNFDFNKWVKQGVFFLSKAEAEKYEEFKRQAEARRSTRIEVSEPEDVAFVTNAKEKITAFLSDPKTTSVDIECANPYKRKLVYQLVEDDFKDQHLLAQKVEKEKLMTIKRLNNKTLKDIEKKEQDKKREDVKCKGLLYIIEAIIDSGKPMVGHNCLLDILHTYKQFLYPLPDSLEEFKRSLCSVFPKLLDTKLIASVDPLKSYIPATQLGDMFSLVSNTPGMRGLPRIEIKLPKKFSGKAAAHTAWYDAYMTGHCFTTFNAFLELQLEKPTSRLAAEYLDEFPVMSPFVNRIFFMFSNDITYIDLAAPDLIPDRSHVFHLTFASNVTPTDISNLFAPFGHVMIAWQCQTSAFVTLVDKHKAGDCFKALKLTGLLADKPFTVQTYEQYLNLGKQTRGGIDTERNDEKRKLENGTSDDATSTDVQNASKKSKLFEEADW